MTFRGRELPMLIGVDLILELVQAVLLTGRLSTDNPVSLMLIASPESGKTSTVVERGTEEMVFCSDATGGGITQELVTHPKATHIIINDLVSVMSHKEHVNKRTFAIISAMTDEGLYKIAMPGSGAVDFKGRRVGIICCVPAEFAQDDRRWWNASGLSTRMLPFAYEYSRNLVLRIKKTVVVSGAYEKNHSFGKHGLVIPDRYYSLPIPDGLAHSIQRAADMAARELEEKGIRRGKQFRALARGHAILRDFKRPAVTQADVDFLMRVVPFISYEPAQNIGGI